MSGSVLIALAAAMTPPSSCEARAEAMAVELLARMAASPDGLVVDTYRPNGSEDEVEIRVRLGNSVDRTAIVARMIAAQCGKGGQ